MVSDDQGPLRIYFLGSGEFAVPVLRSCIDDSRIDVQGVGTQPDRPAGRKRVLRPTAVGQFAARRNLPVDKLATVNSEEFCTELRQLGVEMLVVASFGQILRKPLLELLPFGCFNVHASILPRYRGASPVNAAIIAGDAETGISFMRMDEGLDTGPVYRVVKIDLAGTETAGELEPLLGKLAADNIAEVLWDVVRQGVAARPQDEEGACSAPRLTTEDGRIDWNQSAERLECRIRGLLPWPRAFFTVKRRKREIRIQVLTAAVVKSIGDTARAGEILQADKHGLAVACRSSALELKQIIPQGKKEMTAAEFLRGCPLEVGASL